MTRKKILYIISDVTKSLSFEWIATNFDRDKFDLTFILVVEKETELEKFLRNTRLRLHLISYRGKQSLPGCFWQMLWLIRRERPDVVHTHLFLASLLGLSAAWMLRIQKRIYTRHHSSIHHVYFPKTVKVDRLLSKLATAVVAPSATTLEILRDWEHTPAKKLHLIPHGFMLKNFSEVTRPQVTTLREKYQVDESSFPVIGVVARYTEWKGVHIVTQAFAGVLKKYPKAKLILVNAHGDFAEAIRTHLAKLPASCYREIVFENDIAALYQLFTILVHTPTDRYAEAFGQVYVEAMAAGVPMVVTLSGIATDFVQDNKNAVVVEFNDPVGVTSAINRLVDDEAFRAAIVARARISVQQFSFDKMMDRLQNLYIESK